MNSYDEERAKDIQQIVDQAKLDPKALFDLDTVTRLMSDAWGYGWSTGFGFQGTVDAALQKDHAERGEVEKRVAERVQKNATWTTYRDSVTGHMVTKAYADEHPDTTESHVNYRYPPEVAELVEFQLKEEDDD